MTDIFEKNDTPDPEITFEALVGEGKKFRDPDALAKAKNHADQHIGNLEKEMSELRAELQARMTLEEMMDRLPKPQAPNLEQTTREKPETPRLETGSDKTDLAAEVQRLLKAEKEKEKRDSNIEVTRAGLRERFGSDYNQRLEQIATQLEVSKDFLTGMATTSPSGFFKLIDSVAAPDNNRPVTPPVPSRDPLKNQAHTGRKNRQYYQELRKADPQRYFSSKVQNEMHNEAMKQGADFYQ